MKRTGTLARIQRREKVTRTESEMYVVQSRGSMQRVEVVKWAWKTNLSGRAKESEERMKCRCRANNRARKRFTSANGKLESRERFLNHADYLTFQARAGCGFLKYVAGEKCDFCDPSFHRHTTTPLTKLFWFPHRISCRHQITASVKSS